MTILSIVASPEKLHRLSNALWSSESSKLAINVTNIWILNDVGDQASSREVQITA